MQPLPSGFPLIKRSVWITSSRSPGDYRRCGVCVMISVNIYWLVLLPSNYLVTLCGARWHYLLPAESTWKLPKSGSQHDNVLTNKSCLPSDPITYNVLYINNKWLLYILVSCFSNYKKSLSKCDRWLLSGLVWIFYLYLWCLFFWLFVLYFIYQLCSNKIVFYVKRKYPELSGPEP